MRRLLPALLFTLTVILSGCGAPLPETHITVVATEMQFTPDKVEAHVGDQVFLTLSNKGKLAHNLVILLPSGDRSIAATDGVDAVMIFPARTAGTFRFYCSVPGHEAMQGEITILP
ncbi:cupredoxin domain-containing protein [Oscillochloris sp. ZM17-4]|uniref:cupredoxin domain-containing protein n=1 Tax=Oscillochloris sp. ZM17-4 TaxID=2866714 RepID=UPI001C72C6DE|nr:cupredoxin domain-containing protein [Oscillochloris sp. ZM17-4]MBX0327469.1 cupredoxin domain-containing protein [Oscillochloris sp. ZM17-4]